MEERRIDQIEIKYGELEKRVRELESSHAETKVYIKEILSKIDGLKTDIFTFFTNSQQQDNSNQKVWIEFVKWIIGGTIFVIIAYVFTNQ